MEDANKLQVLLNFVGGYDGLTAIIKGQNKKCACNMDQVDEKIVQLERGFNTQLMRQNNLFNSRLQNIIEDNKSAIDKINTHCTDL